MCYHRRMDEDRRESDRLTVLLLQEQARRRRAETLVTQLQGALQEAEQIITLMDERQKWADDPRGAHRVT